MDQRCRECGARGATGCARCAALVCRDHRERDLCEPCDRELQLRYLATPGGDEMWPVLGIMGLGAVFSVIGAWPGAVLIGVGLAWLPVHVLRRSKSLLRRRFIASGKRRHLLRARS